MILDCGLIELVQNVVTMRSVILNCYEAIGIKVSKSTLQGLLCSKPSFDFFLGIQVILVFFQTLKIL